PAASGSTARPSAAGAAPSLRRALAQELHRLVHADLVGVPGLREGRVHLAVAHVGAVAAREQLDGLAGLRVRPELAEHRLPAGLFESEAPERVAEAVPEQLLLGAQVRERLAAPDIRAEAAQPRHHLLARGGVRSERARKREQLERV